MLLLSCTVESYIIIANHIHNSNYVLLQLQVVQQYILVSQDQILLWLIMLSALKHILW